MDISYESYLLRQYLHEYIDKMKPVSLEYQCKIFGQKGYIEEGHNGKTFPDFATWKKIREMFPRNPIKEIAEMFNIPHQILMSRIDDRDLIGRVSKHSTGFLQ